MLSIMDLGVLGRFLHSKEGVEQGGPISIISNGIE